MDRREGLFSVLDPVVTLQELIRLPSVNPMGRPAEGPTYFERRVTDFLTATFDTLGLPHERHEVHPGRENILARLHAGDDRPTLMLEVHQDTVPVEGMIIEPFAAELRDGRVYGRGACDVKGAMACILAAMSQLVEQRPAGMPNIVVACTVNEEHGFTGAQHLAKLWKSGQSKLLPQPPDAIIVSEPTELNVVVAHKGVVRWKCHTQGKAAHSSDPSRGQNAIYRMADVISSLKGYADSVVPKCGRHPLLGTPTLSVGTIAGGISVNTVPADCVIEIDRRILPSEDPLSAYQHAISHLQEQLGDEAQYIRHDEPFIIARGLKDNENAELAQQVIAAAKAAGVDSQPIGVPFGTDASAFGDEVPTVVFGPGSIAQAHTVDEWIAVEPLHKATGVLLEVCGRTIAH